MKQCSRLLVVCFVDLLVETAVVVASTVFHSFLLAATTSRSTTVTKYCSLLQEFKPAVDYVLYKVYCTDAADIITSLITLHIQFCTVQHSPPTNHFEFLTEKNK